MIVFSNTTPLIALSSIHQLGILPRIFGKIYVVEAVLDECRRGGRIVVPELLDFEWIVPVEHTVTTVYPALIELDYGEKFTLTMARSMSANLVVIDEKIGRNMAEYMGLSVVGTLGILLKAKQLGCITSFCDCARAMREQGIFYDNRLLISLGTLDRRIL